MARSLLIANWKLNLTPSESLALAHAMREALSPAQMASVDVVLCPSFTAIAPLQTALAGSAIAWGAQECFWEAKGAYTGEVSVRELADLACRYCLVGHSERRQLFGETDASVAKKVAALVAAGLRPVLCVGESAAERAAGAMQTIVLRQVSAGISGIRTSGLAACERLVIAYEPVWAIGTGKTAQPQDAQVAHRLIRQALIAEWGAPAAQIPLLYGGSATPETVGALAREPDIDGFLVGSASLQAASFAKMIEIVAQVRQ